MSLIRHCLTLSALNAVALELGKFSDAVETLKDIIEKYTDLSIDMKLVETFYQTMIQNMIESNSNTWRTSDINNKSLFQA